MPHPARDNTPSRFITGNISSRAATGSGKNITPSRQTAASNEFSSNGRDFRLLSDGGAIEVTASSAQDTESRDQIRMHLGHIAKMFAGGNFNATMLIHDQIPPGVPTMQELKGYIQNKFEETEQGARIRISTNSPEALHAIQDFLRFQIKEHKTGDSLDVGR